MSYPDKIKEKTKNFQFATGNKTINPDNFSDHMKKINPNTYTETKKMICDWSDEKNCLIHYRMVKFFIRHGMEKVKFHTVFSFKQSKWLEKYISFHTQRRNKAKKDFEKEFYKLLKNAFYGKTIENVRIRIKVEITKRDDTDKVIKQQCKLTLNGIHKSYENFDSYTFKQNEVLMQKPIYLGFALLELSKVIMYEIYYDKVQPYYIQENIQIHYMDTDSFVLSVNTKDIIKNLKNSEDINDFSNLDENHELFSNDNKTILGKFKIKTHKNIWIDEFIALRSKCYAFKCGDDSKNELKCISKSQSKEIKFEEYYNCLFGGKSKQERDNYNNRALNHEMYFQ